MDVGEFSTIPACTCLNGWKFPLRWAWREWHLVSCHWTALSGVKESLSLLGRHLRNCVEPLYWVNLIGLRCERPGLRVCLMIWAHPYSSSLALSLWQIRLCRARPVLGTHIVVEFSFGKRNLYSNAFTMESTFGCSKLLYLHHQQSASIVVLLSLLVFLFLLFFSPHLFNTCLFLPHNPRPRVCHHSILFIFLFCFL